MLRNRLSNLRYFSRTPYARKAINTIKNPIAMLDWEVAPKDGAAESSELARQIEIVTNCLENPNQDDSFRTLLEQVIEDLMVCGAGTLEQQIGGHGARPLWLWPVDALSIQIYPLWSGAKNEARYLQTEGFGNYLSQRGKPLRNDELIYMRLDTNTSSPYSYGPLEVAFVAISRLLGVSEYAGNVAGNAQPANLLFVKDIDQATLETLRAFWRNEVEGQGQTPIMGGEDVKVLPLRGTNDEALYLKYQDVVRREIAAAFGISPQNLGLESDVNRNTAEVGEDRDWDGTIKPAARLIESHLNREAIHGLLGFSQIEFRFVGLDREDEQATAEIYSKYYQNNAITPNEQRERLGLPPLDVPWGDMTYADVQIAIQAAKSAGESVDEIDQQEGAQRKRTPKPKPKRDKSDD